MLAIYTAMLDIPEEKDKLTQIYEKYYGTMIAVAKSIISDNALAEDAVFDSIMTLIKNLHNITDVSCHKTRNYIVIIVRSRAINLLNKQNRYANESIDDLELSDDEPSAFEILTARESYEQIINYILSLPKKLSDVLYLSVVLGHSDKEIAEILNISNDAVRKRLSRAKAQLKIKLVQEEEIEHGEK